MNRSINQSISKNQLNAVALDRMAMNLLFLEKGVIITCSSQNKNHIRPVLTVNAISVPVMIYSLSNLPQSQHFFYQHLFSVYHFFFLHAVHTGQLAWRRDVVTC